MWKIVLPSVALIASLFILIHLEVNTSHNDPIKNVDVTSIKVELPVSLDAGVDAGSENKRPTPEQLANEFLIWELRDLEKQATSPEDKLLMKQAIDLKIQRMKKFELSNDFEKNMQKALK